MRFLQCVLAEWALVAPRYTRTRLGLSLLVLGAVLLWLGARGHDPLAVTLLAGSLSAIVLAAGVAGTASERRALTTALGHPTTSLAVATGRWVAIAVPASLLVVVCTAALATNRGPAAGPGAGAGAGAAIAGMVAAAAVGSCALALVTGLGNAAATGLFLFMALAGTVAPERLVAVAHPGFVRLAAASALELGPALWHYRGIGTGDWGALIHAVAWTGLGICLASTFIALRRA